MLDTHEYTIDGDGYQGNGNGYDQLDGDWALFYKVAKGFVRRVKPEDREDLLHDLVLSMARVKAKYELTGKPLTEGGLVRIASYEVSTYWRNSFKLTNGINCGQCSQAQRHKCREDNLYRECPKAIKMESLDRLIEDGDGNKVELYQMIADDKAVDLVAMLDARRILKCYPRRAVQIAYKRYAGYPLDRSEQSYLNSFRRRRQKTLF
jgi:hypothetical protein